MNEKPVEPLGNLEAYATEVAIWRVDDIDRHMGENPTQYPENKQYRADIEREREALTQKGGGGFTVLEPFVTAHMSAQMEMLLEVYKQAALDGGRICRACDPVLFPCQSLFGYPAQIVNICLTSCA